MANKHKPIFCWIACQSSATEQSDKLPQVQYGLRRLGDVLNSEHGRTYENATHLDESKDAKEFWITTYPHDVGRLLRHKAPRGNAGPSQGGKVTLRDSWMTGKNFVIVGWLGTIFELGKLQVTASGNPAQLQTDRFYRTHRSTEIIFALEQNSQAVVGVQTFAQCRRWFHFSTSFVWRELLEVRSREGRDFFRYVRIQNKVHSYSTTDYCVIYNLYLYSLFELIHFVRYPGKGKEILLKAYLTQFSVPIVVQTTRIEEQKWGGRSHHNGWWFTNNSLSWTTSQPRWLMDGWTQHQITALKPWWGRRSM